MSSLVSKVVRNEYGSSLPAPTVEGTGASAGAGGADVDGDSILYAGAFEGSVGPDAGVGSAEYAGGGSFEGTVNAFIPGRSGRLVGAVGFDMKDGPGDACRW